MSGECLTEKAVLKIAETATGKVWSLCVSHERMRKDRDALRMQLAALSVSVNGKHADDCDWHESGQCNCGIKAARAMLAKLKETGNA